MSKGFKSLKVVMLVFFFLIGCTSSTKGPDKDESLFINNVEAKWFKDSPKRFKLLDRDGAESAHFFFDVKPEINIKRKSMNYVVETPMGSPSSYRIDLVSGKHYLEHRYCAEPDILDEYDGKVTTPPFSVGIVPGVFDQLGQPQRIIVFGNQNLIKNNFQTHFFEAKIIGGFIEQNCNEGACFDRGEWLSRLVLVGVDLADPKYKKISKMSEIKEKINWDYYQAFLKNGFGNNKVADNFYPAFRIGAMIDAKSSLEFFRKNTVFFTSKKVKQMKKSCFKLYDTLWKYVGKDSKIEIEIRNAKSINELAKLHVKLKKNKTQLFEKRFISLYRKYYKSFNTCQNFINPANINDNKERFWFFTYYKIINRLNELGYSYSCRSQVWSKNPYLPSGKKYIPLEREFGSCSAAQIDRGFITAPDFLISLINGDKKSYRFIEYDGSRYGTHNKLYSLVPVRSRHYQCTEELESASFYKVFPKDINWRRRELKILTRSGVIF